MDFADILILIAVIILLISIIGLMFLGISTIARTSNYECITTDNEIIKCKKVWHHQGYMTGITENNETYTIKSYKEIK